MRKKLNLLFGLVLIISMIALIGCGGSGKTGEKNPYEGKWVAVSAQMMGMSVSIDETFGGAFEFEVKNNGKVSFSVGDTTGNGKWSVEDNQFILSIEGEEMVGIIGKDIISFDNMLEIPFKEAQGVMQIMDHQFVKQGNQVFHLLENKLDTYEYSESGLEFVSSMELDDDFEYLSGDSSGMLYLSPGIGDVIGVKDGEKALQTTVDGDLNMHPSGEWGISFWVNSDTQKIANQGGNLTAEPWILTGLNKDEERKGLFSMIDDVQITNSHIMVAGSMAVEDEGTKIVVYDYDGNQLLKLGGEDISSPDKLGSITGMAETENGFVAADGNMREIQFWAKDGTHVGAISTEDIFGVSYPWLKDMQLLDDGSLLIMLTQERDDGSANELMFFRLTGF